ERALRRANKLLSRTSIFLLFSPIRLESNDWFQGTRRYQSYAVIRSEQEHRHIDITHSYLEDLESFFFVYSHIILAFLEPRVLKANPPPILEEFANKRNLGAG